MMESRGFPLLIEVLGAAGSGKSTLATILLSEPDTGRAPFIKARNLQHLAHIAAATPRLALLAALGLARSPRMTWADFKLMVFATRWGLLLENGRHTASRLVFDQGPIYAVVRLEAKGLALAQTRAFRVWRNDRLADWATRLDCIVWLDAPDDTLISRINRRSQPHWVKGEPEAVSAAFVQTYRRLFIETLRELEKMDGPEVLRFDSSETTPETIAQTVLVAIDEQAHP